MKRITFIGFTLLLLIRCNIVIAQEAMVTPRISISYYKSGDDAPSIKVRVRKRVERRFYSMQGMVVKTYFNEASDNNKIGETVSNEKGEGTVEIPTHLMKKWHEQENFEFIVVIDKSDITNEVSETLLVNKARLTIQTTEEQVIIAKLEQIKDEEWNAVEGVEVKFFIRTDFGKLLVTEDYLETDEDGQVSVLFKKTLPGDEMGKLTIGAMVEDHDEFGNLFAYTIKKWGVPKVDNKDAFNKRSLWSTRMLTPYWLLLFANLTIIGVWSVIIYLVVQIFRIKRLSRTN